jgi:hypothetical protein
MYEIYFPSLSITAIMDDEDNFQSFLLNSSLRYGIWDIDMAAKLIGQEISNKIEIENILARHNATVKNIFYETPLVKTMYPEIDSFNPLSDGLKKDYGELIKNSQ